MERVFNGLFVPPYVPYRDNGEIAYDTYGSYVDWLTNNGVNGIFACGTTSEFLHMSIEERKKILDVTIDAVSGRVPVVYNISSLLTSEVRDFSEYSASLGIRNVSIIAPYYFKHSEESLIEWFRFASEVTEANGQNMYFYNFPDRTGNPITPSLLRKISACCPNLKGGKDSSKSYDQMMNYMKLFGDSMEFITGDDMQIYATATLGCKGAISGMGNVCPRLLSSIFTLVDEHKYQEALSMQEKANAVKAAIAKSGTLMAYKRASEMHGFPMGPMRLPFVDIPEEDKGRIKAIMEEYGVI